ncbi:hypothetical protein PR003_g9676 [Phytophthora rubi]|uniref:PWI domain-containing protein n=1 Tax=Phytophthora rubi TaxID=129364 RepID=A0A6A3MNG0_9STRA|nr:hypothetical protein PR001_g10361 [Phytophthora rubi]KAE9342023.1 hypothetical protein PR003_g9676 [Phytophthora rubi]
MAIRGTSAAQDGRYQAQEKRLLAQMNFPKCFEQRVDMRKVQREVVNQWVTERLTQLLGFEDDIVVALAINLLEPKVDEKLDPRQLQVALTGFLEKQAAAFTEELWQLLLSAQSNPTGIPSAILDQKKRELQRIASEKDELKKVLEAKRAALGGRKTDEQSGRPRPDEKRGDAAAAGVKTERRSPQRGDQVNSAVCMFRYILLEKFAVAVDGEIRAKGGTGKQRPPFPPLTIFLVFSI